MIRLYGTDDNIEEVNLYQIVLENVIFDTKVEDTYVIIYHNYKNISNGFINDVDEFINCLLDEDNISILLNKNHKEFGEFFTHVLLHDVKYFLIQWINLEKNE